MCVCAHLSSEHRKLIPDQVLQDRRNRYLVSKRFSEVAYGRDPDGRCELTSSIVKVRSGGLVLETCSTLERPKGLLTAYGLVVGKCLMLVRFQSTDCSPLGLM